MKSISDCQKLTYDQLIKVEQFGKKATLLNDQKLSYVVTTVDGCLLSNELASDYVISEKDLGHVVVELKGKDVAHGCKQVIATAAFWKKVANVDGPIAALIVSNQYPRVNTQARKAQESFTKAHKKPLHIVTKNFVGRMQWLLSFKGPHKS